MIKEVSLIIPNKSDEEKLSILLSSMLDWKATPNEIIIINTSSNEIFIPNDFKSFYKDKNIHFYILQKKNMYPGGARNFAIKKATNSLLAFLDTSTHPSNDWLSRGLEIIDDGNYEGVWGSTYYEANLFISRIFRACTYGEKPIKTFPGSILHKDVFKQCGLFIESTRAGEDGDIMSRMDLHNINITKSKNFLKYNKLDQMSFTEIIKKWYRNYIHTAKLPYFRPHKDIYFYGISLVAVIAAYNWNRIVDPTGIENELFVPNITKISILLISLIYLYLRGIYLPLKKGANLKTVFPLNFIIIGFMSAILDLTKILAFVKSKFHKNKKFN
jgi:glycosyltransferase involved in cell wall biosynthesis